MQRSLKLGHIWPTLVCLYLFPFVTQASEIEQLLASKVPPDGVVFEIVESNPDDLVWALPKTQTYIRQLHQRFPDLEIAVVSHGAEMFALQSSDRKMFLPTHRMAENLMHQGVDIHVCGTHASWYSVDESAFPAYVDVSPSGPAQINQYLELGFTLIQIERN